MSHVSSPDPVRVSRWLALDVHKLSIVAGVLPSEGGECEIVECEHSERAIRKLITRVGGPQGLAVCYEAGPCGYELFRLFVSMGVDCWIIAPALIPVRPGDRVKTDRREVRVDVKVVRRLDTVRSTMSRIASQRSPALLRDNQPTQSYVAGHP